MKDMDLTVGSEPEVSPANWPRRPKFGVVDELCSDWAMGYRGEDCVRVLVIDSKTEKLLPKF